MAFRTGLWGAFPHKVKGPIAVERVHKAVPQANRHCPNFARLPYRSAGNHYPQHFPYQVEPLIVANGTPKVIPQWDRCGVYAAQFAC